MTGRSPLLLLVFVAAASSRIGAQVPFVAAAVAFTEHRVDAGYGVEVSTGTVVAGEFGAGLGSRLQGALALRAGTLRARSGAATDRDLAALDARASYLVRPWLTLEGGLTVRTYSASIGRQRWVLLRMGGEARVPFLSDGVSGVARLAVFPIASATGLGRSELAFLTAAGMEYRRDRFSVEVLYSLERYDFPRPAGAGVDRHEQLAALVLRLSARRRA